MLGICYDWLFFARGTAQNLISMLKRVLIVLVQAPLVILS